MIALDAGTIAAALLSGAIVGVFLGAFGGGGSVLAAPLLLFLVGVSEPHVAIGTSAAAVSATALFSLVDHWRGGRVKWPCALLFGGVGLLGSIIGSSLAKSINGDALLLAFAFAMAAIGASMMRPSMKSGDPEARITPAIALKLAPLGLITGLASGFFGIGGGFLIVPGLMLASGMTLANATASSLVSVAIFGAATSANYALSGFVDYRLVVLVLAGGVGGGLLGIWVSRLLSTRAQLARRLFAGLILLVAAYVGWQAAIALSLF